MNDFLLELRSEEIPARMQAGARAELEKLFRAQLSAAGLATGELTVWSTPRRLALIARDLPEATAAVSEELKGPRSSAPPQALEGFLRKTGLRQDQLEDRDGVWFAVIDKPGRATAEVLAEAIPAIVRGFAWPKSMRWGKESASSESLRWVRPLSGIVAIFGEELVPCEIGGIASGFATRGHRFHCPGEITIGSASDYAEKLRACHVIVDHEERQAIIRDGAAKAAADAGLSLVEDEGLVIENAGLTEWPVPLLGRFDEAFLEVPPEVIQLTARVNQKYFVVNGADGRLANGFVCTANIDAVDGGAEIVAGNRKVLAARLSDARFFWEQDQKKTLAQHGEKLANITFHEKLGTVADKVERVAKLARWLVEEGIVTSCSPAKAGAHGDGATGPRLSPGCTELADQAELAARLAKADLVTEMVGEFPELQGLMGGYYARAEGLPDAVADAIRDHYKPVGQGDDVPTAPVTVAVALADKLDTLTGFFLIDQQPSGSRDPFALRRAALAIAALQTRGEFRLPLLIVFANAIIGYAETAINWAERAKPPAQRQTAALNRWTAAREFATQVGYLDQFPPQPKVETAELRAVYDLMQAVRFDTPEAMLSRARTLVTFMFDRLKVQQREAGVRHDLIDAVFALGGEDDLVRLLARVKALQAFMATEDGTNLLAGYKRAANILKQAGKDIVIPAKAGIAGDRAPTMAAPAFAGATEMDKALLAALDTAEPAASAAVAEERFTDAMAALASLRAPIDAFFEGVMVNDPDEAVRAYRLGLLSRFTGAVHGVADFSKIEG
ncbi:MULTISPECIES: glycine--tRNA ligase subunit beta [unclassified Sphingopyxis]|uniref:glycine--tRNA ligase subunit beta n=1 Tax=unclassified Sphingopyxis TaxID=2614943 RepID=UPI00072FE991|nr:MULTISPECIES: glycine--tRNA ligase subunit beta [unclassified Sphingopyxis]KTE23360.1 glycine--tRNA ligase subunit beta [Sphingopyxis sp. H057]KTE52224.1 glycine--tRNA ligase subunit beta [Sphingopyxis sp. H073]KTE52410.1 glycine--tRNA ligase subunit beta [Sphingopyxis sp. H071]KTE53363.1 glycine--tRNA ligase subunit beta [Sphingopyxis sp. H107]KTE64727.1 glycine--tRNA ligase subunit beta [Sphingopyxis sp. H100]